MHKERQLCSSERNDSKNQLLVVLLLKLAHTRNYIRKSWRIVDKYNTKYKRKKKIHVISERWMKLRAKKTVKIESKNPDCRIARLNFCRSKDYPLVVTTLVVYNWGQKTA